MRKEELKAYPNPSKHKSFAESIAEDPQYNDRREDLSWWDKRKTEGLLGVAGGVAGAIGGSRLGIAGLLAGGFLGKFVGDKVEKILTVTDAEKEFVAWVKENPKATESQIIKKAHEIEDRHDALEKTQARFDKKR